MKGIQSLDRTLNVFEAVQAWVGLIPTAHNLDGQSSQNLELDISVHISLSAALDLLFHVPRYLEITAMENRGFHWFAGKTIKCILLWTKQNNIQALSVTVMIGRSSGKTSMRQELSVPLEWDLFRDSSSLSRYTGTKFVLTVPTRAGKPYRSESSQV